LDDGPSVGMSDQTNLESTVFVVVQVVAEQPREQARLYEHHGAIYVIGVRTSMVYPKRRRFMHTSANEWPVFELTGAASRAARGELALREPEAFRRRAPTRRSEFLVAVQPERPPPVEHLIH